MLLASTTYALRKYVATTFYAPPILHVHILHFHSLELTKTSIAGENQFTSFAPFFILFLAIATAFGQVYCMNAALKTADAVVVAPVFFAIYSVFSFVNSNLYYDQWAKYQPINYGMMTLGTLCLVIGVYLISSSERKNQTPSPHPHPLPNPTNMPMTDIVDIPPSSMAQAMEMNVLSPLAYGDAKQASGATSPAGEQISDIVALSNVIDNSAGGNMEVGDSSASESVVTPSSKFTVTNLLGMSHKSQPEPSASTNKTHALADHPQSFIASNDPQPAVSTDLSTDLQAITLAPPATETAAYTSSMSGSPVRLQPEGMELTLRKSGSNSEVLSQSSGKSSDGGHGTTSMTKDD